MRYGLLLAFVLPIAACGGSSDNDPLISGSVTGNYDTTTFTAKNGVVGKTGSTTVVALSSGDFGCSTLNQPSPPKGDYAAIVLPSFDVGVHGGLYVQMYDNHGNFTSVGSTGGSIEIVTATDSSISGTVAYSDTIDGKSYGINGAFEVTRCP